ncbi:hypothetical protein [Microscilla marina]|uniref:Uncharacterized protein n=1 Tax=Microscilla marina ATCC 23134 TaxID=313606 RepID=A1ZF77_MICM2|nr:hypothetical protein [Microscilla marina]EAY31179.1 hypothetical protein M23134_07589 [Microscilla marina ATCC 23134]
MITKRQAEKILSLFNSGDEINILLALNLITSLDAFEDIAQYSDEYLGNISHKSLDTMEALYTYQGVKTSETVINILGVWDQLLETSEEHKKVKRKTFHVLLNLLYLENRYDTQVPDNAIKLVINKTGDKFELWLKENWYLKNLSTLLPYIHKANKLSKDLPNLQKEYSTSLHGKGILAKTQNDHHFLDLLDIVRKSKSKIQYALFPAWQPDQANLVVKATL